MDSKILRVVGLLIIVLFAVLFALNVHTYVSHRGMVKVEVRVIPSDSTLLLDSKKVKSGSVFMVAGSHKLTASRQYFDSVSKQINTTDLSQSDIIYLLPVPNSQAAKDWLRQHPEVQQQREAEGGRESAEAQKQLAKKYPIISKLPVYNSRYKIDYALDSSGQLSFTITLFAIINRPSQYDQYVQQLHQYKAEALKFLADNHIDASKYKITYIPDVN